jgi:hypothetical protein
VGLLIQEIDFSRSYFTFRVDTLKKPPITTTHKMPISLNNARIQIDCRCEIRDLQNGLTEEFLLGASCKTEYVNVEHGIWTEPNADFIPVLSRHQFLSIKTFDHAGRRVLLYPPERGEQPHRHQAPTSEAFDAVNMHVHWTDAAELTGVGQVIDSTLKNQPLMARTELKSSRYEAQIDYPVKTINVGEREHFYQIDSGPVLLPDLSLLPEDLLEGMDLAFAAFNCPHWTEFLVRDVTSPVDGISVYHYCRPVRMDTRNQLFEVRTG